MKIFKATLTILLQTAVLKASELVIELNADSDKINVQEYEKANVTVSFYCNRTEDFVHTQRRCLPQELQLRVDSWHFKWENISGYQQSAWIKSPELEVDATDSTTIPFTPEMLGIYNIHIESHQPFDKSRYLIGR